MVITFCDLCKKEYQRVATPNALWRNDDGELFHVCPSCKGKIDGFVTSIVVETDTLTTTFENPLEAVDDGTEID